MARKNKDNKESLSINRRRWQKFREMRRGYWSFVILVSAYALSFLLPVLVSNKALIVHYKGEYYSPAGLDLLSSLPILNFLDISSFYSGETFGQTGVKSEAEYRSLQQRLDEEGEGNWVMMPLYPFSPLEDITVTGNDKFLEPLAEDGNGSVRLLGTDDRGRDVFSRMTYGFQVSISFALLIALIEYLIGIPIGAAMGYFGGKFDILSQRFMEIWASIPFLFLIIIIVSVIEPTFMMLVILIAVFAWLGVATQMRAQFYRERSRDYVAAAVSIGVPTRTIMVKHILPNSLVPLITFFPFSIVGGIGALVSLDFLGFGLRPPTPSWGQMISVGLANMNEYWLVLVPMLAMFITLSLVVFIGEGIREAFDPKVFSRLR
ncbi:MAG: ABC transporter permease subunit [Chlorobi bacterium]|nr:MAG: ABC transporter permease subunit [Bacteroidota bacterium]KXK33699.1 MAG: peptide/nickel transport system permease protein [Chlorobi bacterium OLB6]MBE2265540.1 ABC transporter permease subunit [Flavobacteriales bacterium]MBL1160708.1 ABC transporter permease subunit [Chlorobiota bacterium]MBW7853059.1 ABC transporter permease subunit [Candidatus Kapabacteria bacterium]MCC6331452.1 ABC transporter permease subunit [Ignavibacteria bacterium]